MVIQNNFFDLWDIFVNELIGDVWLTIIIGIIVLIFLSLKFRIPYEVTTVFAVIWLSIAYAATLIKSVWVILVLLVAGLFFYRVSQILER